MEAIVHLQHDKRPGVAACNPFQSTARKIETTTDKAQVTCPRCKETKEFKTGLSK